MIIKKFFCSNNPHFFIFLKVIIFSLIFFFINIQSQSQLEKAIDDIISSSILIESEFGKGSGFILINESSNIYLITASHVLFDRIIIDSTPTIIHPNKLDIYHYPREPHKIQPYRINVDFDGVFRSNLIIFDFSSDIAIIHIGKEVLSNNQTFILYNKFTKKLDSISSRVVLWPQSALIHYEDVIVGSDIYINSYASSLSDEYYKQYNFSRPLIRKGIVAGKQQEDKSLILDCFVFPGMSGAPVIQYRPHSDVITYPSPSFEYYISGIIIEFIPYTLRWENKQYKMTNSEIQNSGFSKCISVDPILELITLYEKFHQ